MVQQREGADAGLAGVHRRAPPGAARVGGHQRRNGTWCTRDRGSAAPLRARSASATGCRTWLAPAVKGAKAELVLQPLRLGALGLAEARRALPLALATRLQEGALVCSIFVLGEVMQRGWGWRSSVSRPLVWQ